VCVVFCIHTYWMCRGKARVSVNDQDLCM
jgi:hypothetical protein